jgi:hypothetical protein
MFTALSTSFQLARLEVFTSVCPGLQVRVVGCGSKNHHNLTTTLKPKVVMFGCIEKQPDNLN